MTSSTSAGLGGFESQHESDAEIMNTDDEVQRLENKKRKLRAKMRKAKQKYADFLSRRKAKFLAKRGRLVTKCKELGMTDEEIEKLCSEPDEHAPDKEQ